MKSLNYHSLWCNAIKKDLKASFCAFENYKDAYQLKVIVNGKPIYRPLLAGTPSDITVEAWGDLYNDLILEVYGEPIQTPV